MANLEHPHMRESGLYKGILERLRTTINEPARTQNPVPSGECGFESHLRHDTKYLQMNKILTDIKKAPDEYIGGLGSSRAAVD
jgi:hypothetical protein